MMGTRSKSRSGPPQGSLFEGPIRSCIGCGSRKAQAELTRVALDPAGEVVVDKERRLPGRGSYLCGAGCLTAALKRKAFGRAFRGKAGKVDPSKLGQAWELVPGP
ncbi:YlxR family RNase P modulator [Stigmatella aurantiaca]|uniref:YlxR family protein n=2 Tax=Archangiaceae TaxID=39 RepID=UPI0031845A92